MCDYISTDHWRHLLLQKGGIWSVLVDSDGEPARIGIEALDEKIEEVTSEGFACRSVRGPGRDYIPFQFKEGGRYVKFDLEEKKCLDNWREIKPGDVCWNIPLPDEEGYLDTNEFKLVLVAGREFGKDGKVWATFLNKSSPLLLFHLDRMVLAEDRPVIGRGK